MTELQTNIARLKELPNLIKAATLEANHRAEIEDAKEQLKQMRLRFFQSAADEVDDAGKKVYSNDKSREARALELQGASAEYKMLEAALSDTEMTAFNAGVELETLRNEFSALKYALEVQTEMMRMEILENTRKKVEANTKVAAYELMHDRLDRILSTIQEGIR